MYEIRPESIKTFITDRNIKLPRFQRKQTWDDKKNFQLCISLFKEYPIGVSILSADKKDGKRIRCLLDGRQRKNALTLMYEDPEQIYHWAQKFIKFKNKDQPNELEDQFYQKINEYIESDVDDTSDEKPELECNEDFQNDDDSSEEHVKAESKGLDFLLEIIKIIHNKQKNNTGFTKPFDFVSSVDKLPYFDNSSGSCKLSSKGVKTFIDEYRNFCDSKYQDFEEKNSFYAFLDYRCSIKDEKKTHALLNKNWVAIKDRVIIIEKIDALLTTSMIGIIVVNDLSPADSQKVFNIINSEGEKLTAVEILSAKPHWNLNIQNPSDSARDAVKELYRRIGVEQTGVVRWDIPATLLRRIGRNVIIKELSDSKSDFEKELTLGFKILSGIYESGVKKEDIEKLSKSKNMDWDKSLDELVNELKMMLKLISSFSYFRYMNSWNTTLMDMTSDAIALNFIIIAYADWCAKGKPIGDSKAKQFQKNCFILVDSMIFEYVYKLWRGSSDSKIANNILKIKRGTEGFKPIEREKWLELLQNQIFKNSQIDSDDITLSLMKPLLYHFYCLRQLSGPGLGGAVEIDHIIPKTVFNESSLERAAVVQNNLLNLGLLTKQDNISKSNKRLKLVEDSWLKEQIEKYEFIKEEQFVDFSNVNNYKMMFEMRAKVFLEAFGSNRDDIINN